MQILTYMFTPNPFIFQQNPNSKHHMKQQTLMLKAIIRYLFVLLIMLPTYLAAINITFDPPKEWRFADQKDLPKSVRVMVVGKSSSDFPPSINLGTEEFAGTMKEYLKKVKEINSAQGYSWKNLGKIKTKAGEASLSQAERKTPYGDVKLMHVMLMHEGTVYMLTGAALKSEFSKYYKDFYDSFRSLEIQKDD